MPVLFELSKCNLQWDSFGYLNTVFIWIKWYESMEWNLILPSFVPILSLHTYVSFKPLNVDLLLPDAFEVCCCSAFAKSVLIVIFEFSMNRDIEYEFPYFAGISIRQGMSVGKSIRIYPKWHPPISVLLSWYSSNVLFNSWVNIFQLASFRVSQRLPALVFHSDCQHLCFTYQSDGYQSKEMIYPLLIKFLSLNC